MPEFRRDPVTGLWIIVATGRAKRPTDFTRTRVVAQRAALCPFCPGNEHETLPEVFAFRSSGVPNQPGWTTRVVSNRFPAVHPDGELDPAKNGLAERMNGIGAHEVIIECPEHVLSLAETSDTNVANLFRAFRARVEELKRDSRLVYTLLFKNHGQDAGASLEHSHSQLISLPMIPKRVGEELEGAKAYFSEHGRCVFCEIVSREHADTKRIIAQDDHTIALAPYASRFPFEIWIVPRNHFSHFEYTDAGVISAFSRMVQRIVAKIDRALDLPAYNFVLHNGLMSETNAPHFHWHLEIIPTLMRVAGFEWGTGWYMNPTAPEHVAEFLRSDET